MSPRDWYGLRRVFRLPLGQRGVRSDVDAELTFHIQGRIEQLMAAGMSRDAAEAETRRLFGDYARIESEVERIDRGMATRRSLAERALVFAGDVRYAVRTLARQPMFTGVVIATLTLGIGATTAIFHVVDRVVLRPLPYPEPEQIVYLGWAFAGAKDNVADALSPRKFLFWHDQSRIFDALMTTRAFSAALGSRDAGTVVQGLRVSQDFFRVVGARPAIGRAFSKEESVIGGPPVVILGHALWTARLGSDSSVIGRMIRLDDKPYTVIGVMPASFELAEQTEWSQVLVPLSFGEEQLADGGNNYMVMGRMRRGVSETQAAQDMAVVYDRFKAAFPELNQSFDRGVRLRTYREAFVRGVEPVLWTLLGATIFVLALACANVANLMLARALSRQREFAVRTALGADRNRLVRQVLVEALVLGLVSAALASVVSLASLHALVALARGALLRETQLGIDAHALWYTTLVAVVASLGVGVGAALPATRIDLARTLSEGGRTGSPARRQRVFRDALVATEAAIAMLLLAGAGLLIVSFTRLRAVDTGFIRDGIVTARVPRVPSGYDSAAAVAEFQRRVLERLRATPGVTSAGAASTLPLERGWNLSMTVDGNPEATEGAVEWRALSPGYFQTLGIPVLRGRDVTATDDHSAPGVVIISQSFADLYWPGENPIGRRIWIGRFKGKLIGPAFDEPAREVIGVVRDLRDIALDQSRPRHTAWVPQAQALPVLLRLPAFAVRATDVALAAAALRRAIPEADARMAAPDISSLNEIAFSSQSMIQRRFNLVLMTIFAAVALGLTSVGIYGVVAYSVARRVHEIGVRMALGARSGNVIGLVIRQGMRPVMIGLVVGLAGSLTLSRVLRGMLYGVGPRDPFTLGAVAALLASVALVASYLPARRATRVDPLAALRAE